jgi:outer membrane receptor for ferrienterochelin and colicin
MKTLRHSLTLFATTLALTALQADGAKRTPTDRCEAVGCTKARMTKQAKVTVTGSMIPVSTSEARHTTSRASGPVVVLTSKDLQLMGARDLADALRRGIPTGR